MLIDLNDLDQAMSDANEAVAALPDENSYYVRGNIYRLKGELEKSVEDYARAIQLRPNSVDLLESRAEVYEMLGKTDEAQRDRAAAKAAEPASSAPDAEAAPSNLTDKVQSSQSTADAAVNTSSNSRANANESDTPQNYPVILIITGAFITLMTFTIGAPALISIGFVTILGGIIWRVVINGPRNDDPSGKLRH